jgi:heme/copper-type cytochrome/quinol oxidase subunit 2
MKKLKLQKLGLFLLIIGSFLFSFKAEAQEINPLLYNTFGELLDHIANFLFYVALIFGPLAIIIGAFMMLSAGASPSKIELGKKIILWSAVIFAIILMIKLIISVMGGEITFH